MKPEKLTDIKKELLTLDLKELVEICLRTAKYKKENKELLNYLLFYADDALQYAELIKSSLEPEFKTLQKHNYYSVKTLRKILRAMNRHIKFTGSKQVEVEMALWFCRNFLQFADTTSSHKPLKALFFRQMERAFKSLPKLHEDLQFDYQQEFESLEADAAKNLKERRLFNFL